MAEHPDETPTGSSASLLGPDPESEPSRRERAAAVLERRLDGPMAVLALLWGGLVAYELVAPAEQRGELRLVGDVVWLVFAAELLLKLAVSGRPLRFLRRRWPAVLFLLVPLLRTVRVVSALRTMRVLPIARIVGSSYRTIGTARTLLGGRLSFLAATTGAVILAGGQLMFLLEVRGGGGGGADLGDTLWWAANLVISGSYVFEPASLPGRLVALLLSGYAAVVFAALAASLGAFFVEQRAELAASEEP